MILLMHKRSRALLSLAWVLALLPAARGGWCHPMGNFSINHETRLEAAPHALRLRYILDLAEIPTVTEKGAIGASGDERMMQAARDAYLRAKTAELAARVHLTIDGTPIALNPQSRTLQLRPGAGGLDTLRLVWEANLPLAWPESGSVQVRYQDDNFPNRLGWKD